MLASGLCCVFVFHCMLGIDTFARTAKSFCQCPLYLCNTALYKQIDTFMYLCMYVSMYKCGCGCMYHVCRTDHPTCILSFHTVAADDVGYVLCMKSTQTANRQTINETHMHNTNTKITTTTQQQQQVGRTAYRTTTRPNRLHTQPFRPGQSRCA